ncbi:hypothetical protein UACE39S_00749 [Ureibacillus acetophenoni]
MYGFVSPVRTLLFLINVLSTVFTVVPQLVPGSTPTCPNESMTVSPFFKTRVSSPLKLITVLFSKSPTALIASTAWLLYRT